MDRMIYTALNALSNQRDQRITQAQNLANMNVPGFRRDLPNEGRTYFATAMETATVRAFQTELGPAGFSSASGPLQQTGAELDLAIVDEGYFFSMPDGDGDVALTRRGDLRRNVEGTLVNGAGDAILDQTMTPIQLEQYRDLTITDIGEIWIVPANAQPGAEPVLAGVIATVVPEEGTVLRKGPDGQIRDPDGEVPFPNQLAKVNQGSLEGSNINTVEELINSIDMQRNFELNIRFVSNAQKLDESSARLLRSPDS
ncbi:flagellar hook-basal body complex protein [Thalassobius sp. Cn5-15]|jgi:flagellar basal-body rod protein FlgF|uniref:flagellar hook-basal body complex protein n=1 Tax=Thalassobius sp. Cn5-15 TaxID=2917763 RepID=UPI001EF2FC3B|nr:flagellar hook-basal body complex protein [Thalassobius sp. Cn5-15]MCG7492789.1 flagellar hook-basal body complex protein [Thalassobius sp. Cn5-15]